MKVVGAGSDGSAARNVAAALLVLALAAGCGSTSPPSDATGAFAATTTPALGSGFTHTPTSSPTPSATPLGGSFATPQVVVLARDLHAPDDLVLAPDGAIYFSDIVDDTVSRLDTDGTVTTVLANLATPEGLVLLPDGSMLVAEQGKNRFSQFDLATREALPLSLELPNKTGQPGVDNILFDADSQTLLVPDSPNGTVLRVSLDGTILQTLARGLKRPASAAVDTDGSVLVAEESANAIVRLTAPGGTAQVVAHIPVPDDMVTDARGNIYAIATGDNALYHIDAITGATRLLLRGLSGPQGIIFDADGNLVITDPGHNRIIKVILP